MARIHVAMLFAGGLGMPEGVAVDGDGFVYCGSMTDGKAYRISPDGKRVQVVGETRGSLLGVALDHNGDMVYCDWRNHAVLRITQKGLVSRVTDRRFGLPNFPVFDPNGNLYVSDSGDFEDIPAVRAHTSDPQRSSLPTGSVWFIDLKGRWKLVAGGFFFANGLALSEDGRSLFVIESFTDTITRLEVRPDGTCAGRETYATLPSHGDGMALDRRGYLYVTLPLTNEIVEVDVDRRVSVVLDNSRAPLFSAPTNCAFGGLGFKDLYVVNRDGGTVVRALAEVEGQRLYGHT